ncbi:hypothetical protein B0H10DRAFT_1958296 [Mycena sp. CBHHK59/15]|nr:hypothetical protein B0H10DRAFT_1958296 [Mycena sp. CBHHK59/15]
MRSMKDCDNVADVSRNTDPTLFTPTKVVLSVARKNHINSVSGGAQMTQTYRYRAGFRYDGRSWFFGMPTFALLMFAVGENQASLATCMFKAVVEKGGPEFQWISHRILAQTTVIHPNYTRHQSQDSLKPKRTNDWGLGSNSISGQAVYLSIPCCSCSDVKRLLKCSAHSIIKREGQRLLLNWKDTLNRTITISSSNSGAGTRLLLEVEVDQAGVIKNVLEKRTRFGN